MIRDTTPDPLNIRPALAEAIAEAEAIARRRRQAQTLRRFFTPGMFSFTAIDGTPDTGVTHYRLPTHNGVTVSVSGATAQACEAQLQSWLKRMLELTLVAQVMEAAAEVVAEEAAQAAAAQEADAHE